MQKLDEEHAEGLDGAGDEEVDDEGGEQDDPAPSAVRWDQLRLPRLPPRRHGFFHRDASPVRLSTANVQKEESGEEQGRRRDVVTRGL